ncbi:MAG: alpha-amylase family glycosyl hydrolase [bacterium]
MAPCRRKKWENRIVLFAALLFFCVSSVSLTSCRKRVVTQQGLILDTGVGETGAPPSRPDAFAGERRRSEARSAPAAASRVASASPATLEHESPWVTRTSIYEVFVDRFGGNLQGVTNRLDYLEKLGVKTIWLMPIFKAMSEHGYNTTDYYAIEPRYGTMNDLGNLVAGAHRKGMRVILDLVMNHCGSEHPWFSSPDDAVRRDHWFIWSASDLGWPDPWEENRSGDISGATWFLDPQADLDRDHNGEPHDDDYYYSVFGDADGATMPDLNFNAPASQAELLDEFEAVMRHWVSETDVDGFRCDAVRYLVENGRGTQKDQPETHQIWKDLRARLERIKQDAILLAEAPTESADQMIAYYGDGDEFHTAFHFNLQGRLMACLKNGRRPADLMQEVYAVQGRLPPGTQDTIFLSNHDRFAGDRVATQLNGNTAKMKGVASLYLLLSGNPAIYYGEEIGMANGAGDGDEPIRLPMDWARAQQQETDPASIFNHYRRLLRLRNTYRALAGGITYVVPTRSGNTWDGLQGESKTLSIIREYYGEMILVSHNFSGDTLNIHINLRDSGIDIPSGTPAHALMGGGTHPAISDSNRHDYGLGTLYGYCSKAVFLGDIGGYADSGGAFTTYENAVDIPDIWYFRGTPNNWGASPMMLNAEGLWETTQTFGPDNPRFKISHRADSWDEAYPPSDYAVTAGPGAYVITFDSYMKQVVGVEKENGGGTITIHYREFEPATNYFIHAWDGLSGDFPMQYEGNFNNGHWWRIVIQDAPAHFKFCFKNSHEHWDGENRIFAGQSDTLFCIPYSSTIYTSRP